LFLSADLDQRRQEHLLWRYRWQLNWLRLPHRCSARLRPRIHCGASAYSAGCVWQHCGSGCWA
jgi:hypothetical protein